MRRDSIFYQIFQQDPSVLFYLLPHPPADAQAYRFDSVAVKEPRFEIDGVFLPPETSGVVYFCEVQFQKDELLYERLFGESLLYFYRNRRRFRDWQTVVIYPDRAVEQPDCYPYRSLLNSEQVQRIYLDELGEASQLPIEVALMLLTTASETQAPAAARNLLSRVEQEAIAAERKQAIIGMVVTILSYKFTVLSRVEIEAMLNIRFEETRLYQDVKQEGRQEEAATLIVRLLNRQLQQDLSAEMRSRITALSLSVLEELGEALLDFSTLAELEAWLVAHQ